MLAMTWQMQLRRTLAKRDHFFNMHRVKVHTGDANLSLFFCIKFNTAHTTAAQSTGAFTDQMHESIILLDFLLIS